MSQQSLAIQAPRSDRSCRLVRWTPWPFENPSLIGHCSIAFAGGWVVHEVPIFRGRDGLSAGVPNCAQLDREGRIKLKDGKRQYTAILTFEGTEARERWRRLVVSALAQAGITDAGGIENIPYAPRGDQ